MKRRDAARAKLRYDTEEGTGDAMNQWKQRRRSMTSTASGGSKRTTWCQAEGNPPTEVTTGLAPGGEQCISPERRRQGGGAPGGPQEAPRAAGRQRKSPRRGRPTGQQRSRRTHHHHRFRRPARREQPADGVHWVHYPPTMRVIADPTRTGARHASKYNLRPTPPGRWGQDGGGEKYPPGRSLISEQNRNRARLACML